VLVTRSPSLSSIIQDNNIDTDARRFVSLQTILVGLDRDGESCGKEVLVHLCFFADPPDALDEAPKDHTFETPKEDLTGFPPEAPIEAPNEISKEVDAVSNSHERKG
jgi:hypothetical protein